MNQTITLTPEQIEAFNAGKPVTITLQKPVEQWEPKGGDWYIGGGGLILSGPAWGSDHKYFGTKYPTKEIAEKARDDMRVSNRLRAYVLEHAPDWEADWDDENQKKCYVLYDFDDGEYCIEWVFTLKVIGAVYMPEQVAKELCEKLNNGVVKL